MFIKRTWRNNKITIAYILIKTISEFEYKIYNSLSLEENIIELTPLYREYDIIAKVKTDSNGELEFFIKKIRSLKGVIYTKTLQ
jgi:DNA-binding Lrp family transcriptional regulator